jgi:hypothetical protein
VADRLVAVIHIAMQLLFKPQLLTVWGKVCITLLYLSSYLEQSMHYSTLLEQLSRAKYVLLYFT